MSSKSLQMPKMLDIGNCGPQCIQVWKGPLQGLVEDAALYYLFDAVVHL